MEKCNLPLAAEFEMPQFDPEIFFQDYWRKKPLFVPQGAKFFLDKTHDHKWFEHVKSTLDKTRDNLFEQKGAVSFIERASEYDDHLGNQAILLQSRFNFPISWFDAIQTEKPTSSGIGSHFDHSDNFILQQQGTKHWKVASDVNVPSELKAKRILLKNQSGDFYFTKNSKIINFLLEPGDLLYIPLNWIHEGYSNYPSLSISLVCPAIPYHSLILKLAEDAKTAGVGYQPVPLSHPWLTEQEIKNTNLVCIKVLKSILNHLNENLVEKTVDSILKVDT